MSGSSHHGAASVRLQWPGGRSQSARLLAIGKSGGAGEVFAIEGMPGHVAKIYHDTVSRAQREQYERKIRWMLGNPPQLPPIPAQHSGVVQLAWPVAIARRDGQFAGFVMEKIDFARTMELDYLLTRRQAAAEGFDVDFGKLVTVCYNLATLIHCLHSKRIAVVDLKPINLKVYKSELYVSILDCDGFTIHAGGFVAEAPQVTPEYLAPEFHAQAVTHPQAQDAFALATIIFRLLNYGIHPYSGISVGRGRAPTELAGRIQGGLYPYGRSPSKALRGAPASVHESFPDSIRALFDRSFAPGAARRASALEWTEVLGAFASRSAGKMVPCAQGHLQFAGESCPTCVREAVLRGHAVRRRQFVTRLQTSPTRALRYVRRSLQGTRPSPFQAALAQGTASGWRLAPVTLPLRSSIAVEIVWSLAFLVTYWWIR